MFDFDDQFAKDYLSDCSEHLETMETNLMALEKRGAQFDDCSMDSVLHGIRYIKGGAGVFGLVKVRELARQTEGVLSGILANKLVATPDRVRVLLNAADKLRDLLHNPGSSNESNIAAVVSALAELPSGEAPATGQIRAQEIGPESGSRRLRILLAEDDFTSRFLLQTFLSRFGECHVAVNGREAVTGFRTGLENGEPYDLVCMDIMMPEMDGREAVRQIRELEKGFGYTTSTGVKIIMTTAVNETREIIRCLRELCDGYLVKPIDLGALVRLMKCYQLAQ